jgi:hypothetical protein
MLCVCSHPQEYTEEFRDIAKGKSKEAIPGIMLINQRTVGEELHVIGLSVFILQYFSNEVFKCIILLKMCECFELNRLISVEINISDALHVGGHKCYVFLFNQFELVKVPYG